MEGWCQNAYSRYFEGSIYTAYTSLTYSESSAGNLGCKAELNRDSNPYPQIPEREFYSLFNQLATGSDNGSDILRDAPQRNDCEGSCAQRWMEIEGSNCTLTLGGCTGCIDYEYGETYGKGGVRHSRESERTLRPSSLCMTVDDGSALQLGVEVRSRACHAIPGNLHMYRRAS